MKAIVRDVLFTPSDFDALPNVKRLEFVDVMVPGIGDICDPTDMTGSSGIFSDAADIIFSDDGVDPHKGWIRLSNKFYPEKYGEKEITISAPAVSPDVMTFVGSINQMDLSLMASGEKYSWNDSIVRGVEINKKLFSDTMTMWHNIGYDCWEYLGELSSPSIEDFIPEKNSFGVTGFDSETDVLLSCTQLQAFTYIARSSERFAVWNNSHIQGISQRFFVDTINQEIVYEGEFQFESNNLNIRDDEINYSDYKIGYAPLMTLDYTGLRRIPMPLPMIRRAMRNPQHLTTAGGKVYAVEDNKIWVGSVDDFMMIDYIEIHSAVDHIAGMDSGIVVSTRQGLFYVASGEGIKRIIGGEMIMSKFLAPCSGGVLSVDGRDIHIIYKQVTDSGSWYPTVAKINNALTEINLEGEIKSVSIGKRIYIADDWNVWIYDMDDKVWAGKKHYKNRIHRLFSYGNKLGLAFETGVDRRNSFNDHTGVQS
jgi:hypothetical protein